MTDSPTPAVIAREVNLRREVRFEPGYDYREEDAKLPPDQWGKRRGVHGMGIRFLLIGELGAIQFLLNTDWLPTDVKPDPLWGRCPDYDARQHTHAVGHLYPMAADLGYHWRTPLYEGASSYPCDVLDGIDACYYDGSGLRAGNAGAVLIQQGHEALWALMAEEYHSCAEEAARYRESMQPKALPPGSEVVDG